MPRKILDDYGIPILKTQQDLKNAKPDELHNLSMAINFGHRGIHTEAYAKAVEKRPQDAVAEGGTKAQIRQRLIDQLKDMRETLERGDIFWPEHITGPTQPRQMLELQGICRGCVGPVVCSGHVAWTYSIVIEYDKVFGRERGARLDFKLD